MLETREKLISGKLWKVTQLPASIGMEIGSALVRLIGPALGKAAGGLAKSDKSSWLDAESLPILGDAIAELARSLGDPEAVTVIKRLVTTGVHCGDQEVNSKTFELIFAGDYKTMLQVAAFAIEVNFGLPFSSWARGAVSAIGNMRPGQTSGPSDSSANSAAGA